MKKAEVVAKKVVDEKNQARLESRMNNSSTSSDEENSSLSSSPCKWKQLCQNGKCTWKIRDKYDDIFAEIHNTDEADRC